MRCWSLCQERGDAFCGVCQVQRIPWPSTDWCSCSAFLSDLGIRVSGCPLLPLPFPQVSPGYVSRGVTAAPLLSDHRLRAGEFPGQEARVDKGKSKCDRGSAGESGIDPGRIRPVSTESRRMSPTEVGGQSPSNAGGERARSAPHGEGAG